MPTVLVIDDATFMRIALKKILEKNGFEVIGEAETGERGIKKYVELQPEIVTMDIVMPDLDGIQALKAIRQHDPQAKVIMISSMGQEVLVREAIMNGAKTFIVKPFKEDHVIEALKKIAIV